jgi:hypothetical protein
MYIIIGKLFGTSSFFELLDHYNRKNAYSGLEVFPITPYHLDFVKRVHLGIPGTEHYVTEGYKGF